MKICIYGASSDYLDKEFFTACEAVGNEIAKAGHSLIFGGGNNGLMGAVARGAHNNGGEIIGIAPKFFDEEGVLYKACSDFIFTETMHERKHLMEEMADAFIVLPGGIGTYEEFFETLTLKQLGKHDKPIVILNTLDYYEPMLSLLKSTVERGFMSRHCLELFDVTQTPSQCITLIKNQQSSHGSIHRLQDYNK